MSLDKIKPGNNLPDHFNVVIEIPCGSGPVKYEIDKDSGALVVDRFLATAMYYPANYGYIPQTLSEDGDPVDVLVITPTPLLSGSVIACRPVGKLNMTDESGVDAKILAVPDAKLLKTYQHINSPDDLDELTLQQISHFFEHYKDLEAGKWTKITGWEGAEAAKAEIMASYERFSSSD